MTQEIVPNTTESQLLFLREILHYKWFSAANIYKGKTTTYPCLQWEESAKFRTSLYWERKTRHRLTWSCSTGNFAALMEIRSLRGVPEPRWGWGPMGGMCSGRWGGKKGCLSIRTVSLNTLGQIGCAWHQLFCHYLANKQGGIFSKQFHFPILNTVSWNAFADWIARAGPEMDIVYQLVLCS